MKKLFIIKIGGNVIDNPVELEKFLTDFSKINDLKILVHGGGVMATELANKLGISQTMIEGRRVTDSETLNIATMVYAGLINKQIVASLQVKNTNSIGLSGADGNSVKSNKRKVTDIDYGFVGNIAKQGINSKFISTLLEVAATPVFCAITHDAKGQLLNTNADTIASALAVGLSELYEVHLHYCFEKKGVLMDLNDDNSFIKTLTKEKYKQLLNDGIISKGMIPKLDNAFEAIGNGVNCVVIAHANDLLTSINKNSYVGTTLLA